MSSDKQTSYMERINPNLVIFLHYLSKTLWIVLAAFFGVLGVYLYSIGITSTGNAGIDILGIRVSLDNAGPGLVVMVVALLCSLTGAIRAKVIFSRDMFVLTAAENTPQPNKATVIPTVDPLPGMEKLTADDYLETNWGLTWVVMLRIPISIWASVREQELIEEIHKSEPQSWHDELLKIARLSPGFKALLKDLGSKEGNKLVQIENLEKLGDVDFSLPWCVRLKWSLKRPEIVNVYIYATGGSDKIKWQTLREEPDK